jgi:hypothetical protein
VRKWLLTAVILGLGGCGGDEPPAKPPAPVSLRVVAPADLSTVDDGTVQVRGTVQPAGARVSVLGRRAEVSGGAFTARVPLEPGANVIDVAASAHGRTASFAALRVSREVRIRVPDLGGRPADEAERSIEALGLDVRARRGGGFIDHLLPGDIRVCAQEPQAGTAVRRGATVRLLVARSC